MPVFIIIPPTNLYWWCLKTEIDVKSKRLFLQDPKIRGIKANRLLC